MKMDAIKRKGGRHSTDASINCDQVGRNYFSTRCIDVIAEECPIVKV